MTPKKKSMTKAQYENCLSQRVDYRERCTGSNLNKAKELTSELREIEKIAQMNPDWDFGLEWGDCVSAIESKLENASDNC